MKLTIVLVLLAFVAVALAQNTPPLCDLNMSGKKCNAEEDFPKCNTVSLTRTECVCGAGTKCKLEDNDGSCDYSCEPFGDPADDGNAGMGPGVGMDD